MKKVKISLIFIIRLLGTSVYVVQVISGEIIVVGVYCMIKLDSKLIWMKRDKWI